jgi:hypothetical protein
MRQRAREAQAKLNQQRNQQKRDGRVPDSTKTQRKKTESCSKDALAQTEKTQSQEKEHRKEGE